MSREDKSIQQQIADINVALLAKSPTKWRIANSFLHVLNFSSKNLKFYAPIMVGHYGIWLALQHVVRGAANVIASFAFIGPSFFGDKLPRTAAVLFISHLNRPADFTAASDQYFGNIADLASVKGMASGVVMLNKCRARKVALDAGPSGHAAPRIVCAAYLSPFQEAVNFLMLLLTGVGAALRAFGQRGLGRRVGVFTGLAQASARALIGLRFRHQILQVVKVIRPKTIIFTYEGHPWERLLCQAIRAKFPEIELIGYQHSIVLSGPKAMTSDMPQDLSPHRLMVTSQITADLLRKDGGVIPKEVISVGSTKYVMPHAEIKPRQVCSMLVVPEGTPEDTLPMVEFAIALGHLLQQNGSPFTITLRLHPLLNFEWLKAQCRAVATMPNNIVFSSRSLAEDAADAAWILYRGSTAIFTAIAFGGRPLFLEFDGDASANDPLASGGAYRLSITSVEEAMDIMLTDMAVRNDSENEVPQSNDQQQMMAFAAAYFPALNEAKFLQELRSSSSSAD